MNEPWEVPSQLQRDPPMNSRGQFQIKCEDGKPRWYTRCTTYIKVLEDRSRLEAWKMRKVLIGLHADVGLQQELVAMSQEQLADRDLMDKLVDRIFRAGDGYLAAERGTRDHKLAELFDTLQPLPPMTEIEQRNLHTYVDTCQRLGIQMLLREQRVVIDHLKVTGTPDAVARYRCLDGVTRNVIVDEKTKPGAYNYGRAEVAQQLAMYADGVLYEDDGTPTGKRSPLPDVSKDIGLMLHIPQDGSQQATVYEVDLRMGRHLLNLSGEVRRSRNYGKHVFTEVPLP